MTVTLLTNKTCGPCMVVKNKLKALNLEVDIKDFSNADDQEIFRKYSIKSVPRLLIEDDEGNIEIIQGIDDIVDRIKKSKNTDV